MMAALRAGARELDIALTPGQLERFELYYRELVDWNRQVNLTAITGYEDVQVRHFLDSLTVVLATGPLDRPDLKVIDIGTGAGLPGIPLKIAFPGIRLTLLEATGKKVRFLEYLVGRLGLGGVALAAGRAEELGHDPLYRERFDLVLCRAVAALPALVELGLPFNAAGGRLVAWKKGDISRELEESRKAVAALGGRFGKIVAVDIDVLRDGRCLVVVEKVEATPEEYPRRPGLPTKRPIR
jgi:16S rRNA (guanine527-N7)-methyltransferase